MNEDNIPYTTYELQVKDIKKLNMISIKHGSINIDIVSLDANKTSNKAEYRVS